MKERQTRSKSGADQGQQITKAVTHIRLGEVNAGKLAALNALAAVYLALSQQYVTLFCTEEQPDTFHAPVYSTPLSERWHRVAIQQAAGIAQSWRTNREQAYQDAMGALAAYQEKQADGTLDARAKEPHWREWQVPTLKQVSIQANVNVVALEVSQDSTFEYWLRIGTFHGKLRERQKRDREKRRRKAKLRACLEKKGVKKLPATSSKSGQRLRRHVKQEINRAVNLCMTEHPEAQFAYEQLSMSTMRFKARAMNAYLRASNLAHIPKQIAWNAATRGRAATRVKSAYSSQECSMCHYMDRKNRPDQQTFCCQVCGQQTHADVNAARNLQARWRDEELRACKDRHAIKAVLMQRHTTWREHNGWS